MVSLPFVPSLAPPPEAGEPLVIVVDGLNILVEAAEGGPRLPERSDWTAMAGPPVYLGQLGPRPSFGAPLLPGVTLPPGMALRPARELFPQLGDSGLALVGQAIALVEWDTMHRFCGRCAEPTTVAADERARRCPRCEATFYPRISPAVIVLVERGDELLLARNARFPRGRFSILAGFVETGESLEEAAVREVREEVGIEIADLRYVASQPWPFGRSLMIGFVAQYASGDIRVDGTEIAEAGWFGIDTLPDLPPKISIARRLIDAFVARVRAG